MKNLSILFATLLLAACAGERQTNFSEWRDAQVQDTALAGLDDFPQGGLTSAQRRVRDNQLLQDKAELAGLEGSLFVERIPSGGFFAPSTTRKVRGGESVTELVGNLRGRLQGEPQIVDKGSERLVYGRYGGAFGQSCVAFVQSAVTGVAGKYDNHHGEPDTILKGFACGHDADVDEVVAYIEGVSLKR